MSEQERENSTWRKDAGRSSRVWALATVVMAVIGFSFVGAISFASAAATVVSHSGGPTIPADLQTGLHAQGSTHLYSYNWGGYGDTGPSNGSVTEAFGEWYVPTLPKCTAKNTPGVQDNWVGIDGLDNDFVEQAGTYGYCYEAGYAPSYWDWFEFYPYESIVSVFPVNPGDIINAYVLYNPYVGVYNVSGQFMGTYTLVVNDLSNYSNSFYVVGDPATCDSVGCEWGPGQTSECISEALTDEGYYLPNYGKTTFLSCDTTINGKWGGIGGLPTSAHATVYLLSTLGWDSGLLQQSVSKLSTFDYKYDEFTITWKRLD